MNELNKEFIKQKLEEEIDFLYEKYKDDEETVERLERIRISYYYLYNMCDKTL